MAPPLEQNLREIQQLRQQISSVRRRAQRRVSKYLDQSTTAYQTGKRLFTEFPVGSLIVTVGLGFAALATAKSWWQPLREQTESTCRNWDWQRIYESLFNAFAKSTASDEPVAESSVAESSVDIDAAGDELPRESGYE
ncbi:MAG: hypothetical protein ACI9HK_000651 [Pirellulaceae bacterium]|jgi:hypothetical protein